MFVVNIPVDATERELVVFFRWAGVVERVVFAGEGVTLGEGEGSDGSDEEDAEEVVEDEEEDEDEDDTTKKSKSKKKQQQKEQVPKVVPLPSTSLRTLRQTGQTAYVIFLESSSLIRALTPSSTSTPTPRPWPHSSTDAPSGLSHYTTLYTSLRPSLPSIVTYTTSVLEVYDYTLAQKKQKSEYRKGEAVVDEDGFTVVVRGGAYGKTLGGGVGVARKGWGEGGVDAGKKKGKKKESKEGMYAFQRHEKNRKRESLDLTIFFFLLHPRMTLKRFVCFIKGLLDLRAKFEEDKAKIAKHREQRKFKPY